MERKRETAERKRETAERTLRKAAFSTVAVSLVFFQKFRYTWRHESHFLIFGSMNPISSHFCVLVTRPQAQADVWRQLLPEAEIFVQPTIEIGPPEDAFLALDAVLERLGAFTWVVFSSVNGVWFFLQWAAARGILPEVLATRKLAAIGAGTQKALEDAGLSVHFVPQTFQAESLAEGLTPFARQGETFLLVRASRGREILAETLELACPGCTAQVVAYASTDVTPKSAIWQPEILAQMLAGQIGWTTVTSSAIAVALVHLFGEALRQTRLASISPLTTAKIASLGFSAAVEAPEATMESLAMAIRSAEKGRGSNF